MNRETMTRPCAVPRDQEPLPPVEIAVIHVATSHARYEWDSDRQVIRLASVQNAADSPFDATLFDRGEVTVADITVPALIARRIPTFPGCHLAGRVIGLHEEGDTRAFVAVPVTDPAFQRVATLDDLPEAMRARIAQAMPSGTWHGADAARGWYRELLSARRTEQAHQRRRGGRTWQATTVAPMESLRGEAERHSTAEYHLRDVPARFQDYVIELLLPTERILALVHRPPPPSQRGFFHRETLPEALLVVTDRQMLTMADTLPPDVTMARWGFVAESAPLARLADVGFRGEVRTPVLTATFTAATGQSAIDFALPNGHAALEAARHTVQRFIPRPGSRALQCQQRLRQEQDNWTAVAQLWQSDSQQWEVFTALHSRIAGASLPGETVQHVAVDPAWDGERGAILLALTPSRLLCAEEGKPFDDIPLARIATAKLQHAPIGSWFGVTVPEGGRVREHRFHCYAFTYGAFAGLFTALRQGIGAPVGSWTQHQEREAADG